MRAFHLNCGSFCPLGWHQHADGSPGMVCHCLVIETPSGLVLVDTGFGTAVMEQKAALIGQAIKVFGRPVFDPQETALAQLLARGYQASDVRHIVVTHLDPDHAGGIADFPHAKIHVYEAELREALNPRFSQRARYRQGLWAHAPKWVPHLEHGEGWFGFEAVRDLPGLPPEVLLVPLIGHTAGHCGVAVDLGSRWLLHCGDAYFHAGEMADPPRCPAALRVTQRLLAVDNAARLHNQAKLRALRQREGADVQLFSAHDTSEFLAYA